MATCKSSGAVASNTAPSAGTSPLRRKRSNSRSSSWSRIRPPRHGGRKCHRSSGKKGRAADRRGTDGSAGRENHLEPVTPSGLAVMAPEAVQTELDRAWTLQWVQSEFAGAITRGRPRLDPDHVEFSSAREQRVRHLDSPQRL